MTRLVPVQIDACPVPPMPRAGQLAWLLRHLDEIAIQNQTAALTPEQSRVLTRAVIELSSAASSFKRDD